MAGIKSGINGQINNNIVTDGLVLSYDAAYKKSYPRSGTTTFNLASGSLDATIDGATWYGTNPTSSFNFDGIDDKIIISPSTFTTFDEASISMWVKVLSDGGSYRGFFSARNATSGNDFTTGINVDMMSTSGGTWDDLNVEGAGRIGYEVNQMTTSINFGVWAHLGVTISTSVIEVYINGQQQNSRSRSTTAMGVQYLSIGARYYNSAYRGFLNADISGIQLYNRVLSNTEITQNYQAQKERFGL
jgi:hypothetical protein